MGGQRSEVGGQRQYSNNAHLAASLRLAGHTDSTGNPRARSSLSLIDQNVQTRSTRTVSDASSTSKKTPGGGQK